MQLKRFYVIRKPPKSHGSKPVYLPAYKSDMHRPINFYYRAMQLTFEE